MNKENENWRSKQISVNGLRMWIALHHDDFSDCAICKSRCEVESYSPRFGMTPESSIPICATCCNGIAVAVIGIQGGIETVVDEEDGKEFKI